MRVSTLSRLLVCSVFALALSTGCALFGGSDEEDLGGTGTRGTGEFDSGTGDAPGDSGAKVAELETIYFDYDRATIRDDQKPTLRQNAAAVRDNASWQTVIVEGHCDERGSEEYNLALGERRANSVRQYLVDSGVSAIRIDTVSFGEGRPAVAGHDESAWKWNRRANFRVIK